mgnify:CR=1 FL=1
MSKQTNEITILSAKAATGVDNTLLVSDYETITVSFATANSGSMTVKCAGSLSETSPTWTSAQSVSNMYDFIQMVDLNDGSTLDGDTGVVLTGTDDFRQFEINVNGLKWLTFRVTAWAAGNVTVKATGFKQD